MGPIGPNVAIVPNWEKQKSGVSTFGMEAKVVRAEILHMLVCIPSREDPYSIVSRTFIFCHILTF